MEKELFNPGRKSFPASDYYKIITQDFEVLNHWRLKWLVSILIIDPQRVRSFLYHYLLTPIPIITIYHHQVA